MEVYLAYMLMYANNDLGRVAYEVADEYGYTESKVAKLQVEFARRFKTKEDDIAFLNRIFNAMINKTDPHRIVPIVRKETISFTLYDAGDARKLRNIICRTGMMAISDSSKLVFNSLYFSELQRRSGTIFIFSSSETIEEAHLNFLYNKITVSLSA